ncbi:hypothetical protein [Merismopedia glauca]|uniref:Uncharacterized protein n=1 Tax=Merismopedia glauca CCAP 1448/3 TaxID=1296344 RepID=A0A2T1C9G6_9CYAN|nr:hypothetical protein [Merismopedia glauca]PSB04783.1 hypothetical protein C7B64_02145 [Merismopedia glauca CCAP 1448/3]
MLELLISFLVALKPLLVPICSISAWILIFLVLLSLWSAIAETIYKTQQMHQIPCSQCQFFCNDYRLKCTVHPDIANSEEAIGCRDYLP